MKLTCTLESHLMLQPPNLNQVHGDPAQPWSGPLATQCGFGKAYVNEQTVLDVFCVIRQSHHTVYEDPPLAHKLAYAVGLGFCVHGLGNSSVQTDSKVVRTSAQAASKHPAWHSHRICQLERGWHRL